MFFVSAYYFCAYSLGLNALIGKYSIKCKKVQSIISTRKVLLKPQQGFVQVWLKLTLEKDSSDEAEQYRNHVEINCKAKSYKVLEESKTDTAGDAEKTQQASTGQLRHLPLESAMGALWSNLCPYR